jgi:hypothetical protein
MDMGGRGMGELNHGQERVGQPRPALPRPILCIVAFAAKIAASATEHKPIKVKVPDTYEPKSGPNPWLSPGPTLLTAQPQPLPATEASVEAVSVQPNAKSQSGPASVVPVSGAMDDLSDRLKELFTPADTAPLAPAAAPSAGGAYLEA